MVASYSFDTGGVPAAWSATDGASLAVVAGAGTAGSPALRAAGLDSAHWVRLGVDTRGYGPFVVTADVRIEGSLPAVLTLAGWRGLNGVVQLDPTTYVEVRATMDAGTINADWFCNGTMTGGQFPGATQVEFRVRTRCGDLDPARALLIDDVKVVRDSAAGTPRVRPAATTVSPSTTTTPTTTTAATTTTARPTTTSTPTTSTPTTTTTTPTTTTTTPTPTVSCPSPTTTTKRPTTSRTTTHKSTTTTSKTRRPTTKKSTTPRTTKPHSTKSTSPKPTTSQGTPELKCKVSLVAENAWPGGWSASLNIANLSPQDVTPWKLTATVPAGETLSFGWPATFTQSGTTLTGVPPTFQGVLEGKSKVQWGLVLAGGQAAPTGWAINGTACVVD
ncbi:MAG: cellulose binding domain-containing protein [Kineosporiaceae bacterium]